MNLKSVDDMREEARREMWEKMRRYCIYARPAIAYHPTVESVNCIKRRYQPCEYEECPILKEENV